MVVVLNINRLSRTLIDSQMAGIYVGRGSKWGNPYRIKDYTNPTDRDQVIELYRKNVLPRFSKEDLAFLKGKNLLCYCAPQPCHGDLLLEAANKAGG